MRYTHDFSGREISEDAYRSLPVDVRRHYHPVREESSNIAADLIDIGIEAAKMGIILGDFSSDSSDHLGSSDNSSDNSSGFDGGFGGGDYSGGGAGADW